MLKLAVFAPHLGQQRLADEGEAVTTKALAWSEGTCQPRGC